MTATVHDLATHLGGHVVDTDHGTSLALPDGGFIYSGFTGAIRLQRYGLPVVTLGGCSDPVEVLAAAYRKAVAS